jgi:hypothetical protein
MIYPRFEEAQKLVADGLVSKRKHPTLPLYIYNYTPKAVHEFGPTKTKGNSRSILKSGVSDT